MSKTTRLLRLLRLSPKRPGSTGRGWALAPLPAVFAGEDWGGREEEKGEGRREGGGQRRGREKPKGGGEEEGEGRRGRKRTGGRREQGRENREEGGGSTGGRREECWEAWREERRDSQGAATIGQARCQALCPCPLPEPGKQPSTLGINSI